MQRWPSIQVCKPCWLALQPYYQAKSGYEPVDYTVENGNCLRPITLPLNLRMTDSAIHHVLEAVSDIIEKNRRFPTRRQHTHG